MVLDGGGGAAASPRLSQCLKRWGGNCSVHLCPLTVSLIKVQQRLQQAGDSGGDDGGGGGGGGGLRGNQNCELKSKAPSCHGLIFISSVFH